MASTKIILQQNEPYKDRMLNNNNNNNNNNNCNTDDKNSKSAQALVEVRRQFLEYADANPDKVNDRDKHKLATDDWYLKRYLLARHRRVKDTMNMLRKTMEWRNEFGLHISEDAMFPHEFYKIGALFPYECDRQNNLVLYLRVKYHRKVVEMVEVEKHFLVHTFEKIDRITNGQGMVILFDCQGAGYVNCDMEFMQFLISCATEHAPVGLQYLIVYKMPWYLNAFWTLARKLLPAYLANRIRFCDENTITEFIDPANLPDFMNGTCRRNYRWIPPGCPSIFKLANAHGISDAEINKILPQFQTLLDEADEAMATSDFDDPPDSVIRYVNNPETAPNLLSDLALCSIGLGSPQAALKEQETSSQVAQSRSLPPPLTSSVDSNAVVRIFPNEFIEFKYDAYNDTFHGSLTIYNPSKLNSLGFKLMSNRPSNYSVKPSRGILLPESTITLSILLLDQHKSSDRFLVVAQPIEGEVLSITKAQFDALWSSSAQSSPKSLRSVCASHMPTGKPTRISTYRQNLICTSIIFNIILMLVVMNLLFFN